MGGHRLCATQDSQRAAHNIVVIHQIIIDKKALVRISAPNPTVTLDSVKKALARIEVQGISGHLPNFVD